MSRFHSASQATSTRLFGCLLLLTLVITSVGSTAVGQAFIFSTIEQTSSTGSLPTRARGINASGQIIGFFTDTLGVHGYVLPPDGNFIPFDVPNISPPFTEPLGINSSGTIVGLVTDASGTHAFVRDPSGGFGSAPYYFDVPGDVLSLNGFVGGTEAAGINDQGDIIGTYDGSDGQTHAFLIDSTGPHTIDPAGSTFAEGWGLNSATPPTGVGHCEGCFDGLGHGWEGLSRVDFYPPTDVCLTTIRGINNSEGLNTVEGLVGAYRTDGCQADFPANAQGFFRRSDGRWLTIDVPNSQWTIASGINDSEQIVGFFKSSNAPVRGFQLLPIQAKYALLTTSPSCSAIVLSGGSYVDAYDSNNGPYSPATRISDSGNVVTAGGASLSGGSTVINGTVFTPPGDSCSSLSTSGGATATGGVAPLMQAVNPLAPPRSVPTPSTVNTSPTTITPGTYGNLSLQKNISIPAGVYNVNSLSASGGIQIQVTGPVVINIAGQNLGTKPALNLSGGSQFVNLSNRPSDLVIAYSGAAKIQLSGGSQSAGLVYAPNAPIVMSGASAWSGAIVGSTYSATGGAPLHYDLTLSR